MRLTEEAWETASGATDDLAILREWLGLGRPLIVRRPCRSEDGSELFVGLALPGKRRLAFTVDSTTVRSVEPPPFSKDARFCIPGFALRLFGSHAWQELSGLTYVTDASDLDLLVNISSPDEWRAFLALNVELPSRPAVDLEVVFRGDASFNWREYVGPAKDILIKGNRRVWLERKDRLALLLS